MFTVPSYYSGNGNNILKDYTLPTVTIGNVATLAGGLRTNSTVSVPTGTVDGDLIIFGILTNLATVTVTGPTPITSILDTRYLYLYSRVASSEPASYTFNHSNAWSSGGAITLKPEAGHTLSVNSFNSQVNASSVNGSCPSLSGVANSILLCFVAFTSGNGALTGNPNPAMTEKWEIDSSSLMTNYLMTMILTRTAATGIKRATISSGRTSIGASVLVTQT